jgi:hypothetical protein
MHKLFVLSMLGVVVSEGFSQSTPLQVPASAAEAVSRLPKPEDPVLLPSDDEIARWVRNVRESSLKMLSYDEDGWDDLWVMMEQSINKDYHFDPEDNQKDSDGDGMSDYEEMLVHRRATFAEPVYTKEQQIEMVRKAREQAISGAIVAAEEQARVRKILEPWMHEDVPSGVPGKVFSVEELTAEKRQRLGQGLDALRVQTDNRLQAGKAAAARLGMPEEVQLPGGGAAVVVDEVNGLPQYIQSRNIVSADTISADALWPSGASGLNLTGQQAGQPRVKLGVWEPTGLFIDHTEFAVTNTNVDALDAATGWTATGGSSFVLNTAGGNMREGTGCLNLVKPSGAATILYSRTQPTAADFTNRTVLVWYFNDNRTTLAATGTAIELRFGSGIGAYWSRTFELADLSSGWNILSMQVGTATGMTGAPVVTACNYTALNITYAAATTTRTGTSQRMDFWRLSDTRVVNMDRTGSVGDHSTHVTGTMGARGANTTAQGIAFASTIHSRNARGDHAEMAAIFANMDSLDDTFASNHSYGPDPGWSTLFLGAQTTLPYINAAGQQSGTLTVAAGTYGNSLWNGDLAISGQEDFTFGFYSNNYARAIDSTVYGAETLLPVWAAGNDRGSVGTRHVEFHPTLGAVFSDVARPADGGASGYDCMPPDSVAKNILTVGAINDLVGGWTPGSTPQMTAFSCFGPTDDGRIKPDVVANGQGVFSSLAGPTTLYGNFDGTSQAAPSVAGTVGLLLQYLQGFRGSAYQPPASMLKGLLIHTANDILNAGPDYQSGWGVVNAQAAAEQLTQSETVLHGAGIRMTLLQTGVTRVIPIRAVGGGLPIKITVCSTDPPGPVATNALDPGNLRLVNDFTLQVTTTGGGPFNPFVLNPATPAAVATTGVNNRDNVEQVVIANPVAGQLYMVNVGPAAGETFVDEMGQASPQPVSIVISGIQSDPTLTFRITDILKTGTDAWTVVWPAVVGVIYRVQTSTDLISWTDTTGDIMAETDVVAREVINATPAAEQRFWRVRKVL